LAGSSDPPLNTPLPGDPLRRTDTLPYTP
jgi:hypothetical protein